MRPAASRRTACGLFLALAAAAAGATAAIAEEVPQVVSPLRVETDHNGVNLVNGRIQMQGPVLGVPAAPNLRFDRIQNAAPYFDGRINTAAPEGGVSTASFSVHTGTGSSESFQCVDSDCASVTGTGSVFVQGLNRFRQAGTGAEWRFTELHVDSPGPPRVVKRYASSVTWPNGEVISYTYQEVPHNGAVHYRPTRISSNLGYYITIAYQGDVFLTNAWGQVRVAALYSTADPQTPLQQLTYGAGGTTITDIGGRAFTCAGCVNQLGLDLETGSGSLTLPGEGSPTLQVTLSTHPEVVAGHPLVGSVTRDGVTWTYSYDGLDFINAATGYRYAAVIVTGPNGFNQVYRMTASDGRNVIDRVTDSIGRTTDYSFDASYRPVLAVYPELNRVSVGYDPVFGNIVSRTTTSKSGSSSVGETAFYDTEGCIAVMCYRPSYALDGLNRRTDFAYADLNANGQPTGQLTERTDPADAAGVRRRTIVDYPPGTLRRRSAVTICGTGAACGTGAQIRTEYTYWRSTFLPLTETRVSGGTRLTTTYAYDNAGRVTMVDGPLPGTGDAVFYRYDAFGRKVREVGPLGDNGMRLTQLHTYRPADDRITRTDTAWLLNPDDVPNLLSWVELAYDARRNPIREMVRATNSAGTTTTYTVLQRTFDQRNRLHCEARRMNPAQFAVSLLPASACERDNVGTAPDDYGFDRITHNVYDEAGQLIQVRRGVDTPLAQTYAAYTYSPNGRRSSVTDANGNRTVMCYDGFDRQSRWMFQAQVADCDRAPVATDDYEAYGYDAVGNRTSLRKRDGSTLTYAYDALNRMTRKTVPERLTGPQPLDPVHTRDVFYGYNVLDLPTFARFGHAGGEGVTNSYDAIGRLLTSTTSMSGLSRSVARVRDDVANHIRLTYGGQTYRYELDDAGRLTDLYEDDGTPALLHRFTYNARGQVDFRYEVNSSVDYQYDRIGRLDFMTHAFAGGAGNVTLDVTRYNPANQIDTRTRNNDDYAWNGGEDVSRNYSVNGLNQYTAAGGTTFAYDANGNLTRSGSNTYVYDVENRLVAASGGNTARLVYDPLGRLFEVTGTSTPRRFLWDGDALVAEYTSTGSLGARFVHGTAEGVDDPLVWYGGGENRRLHADHQGSIVAITYGNGAIRWINGYDEWGIPNDPVNTGRFQYTGQLWIGELGMYHYKARVYSPTLGRFLQVDPVGYEGGINLYAYVNNDPIDNTDASGLDCDEPNCNAGVGAAVGLGARATFVGVGSERARIGYEQRVEPLARDDTAGRSAAKADARAATPREVRAVIENRRPGLGPRPGSGGRANVTNPNVNRLARTLGTIGRAAGVATVVTATVDIATSENPGRAAVANVTAAVGGALGGAGGAIVGGFGGPAAPVTVPAGAVAGAVGGGAVGYELGEGIYDFITGD